MAAVLRRQGARVDAVATAPEALQAIVREPPDVLLSDVGLPGQDGYALIRQVRALGPDHGGRVPAGALTALTRSQGRTPGLLAGFQMHVPKPVQPVELVTVVASLAQRTPA